MLYPNDKLLVKTYLSQRPLEESLPARPALWRWVPSLVHAVRTPLQATAQDGSVPAREDEKTHREDLGSQAC
jgi:hypothetical protein